MNEKNKNVREDRVSTLMKSAFADERQQRRKKLSLISQQRKLNKS
jgi:hypothetical protein